MDTTKKELTRRSFITGAAVAAATAGLVGCSEQANEPAAVADNTVASVIPETWDREVDVVLLGTGSAISAAYKSADLDLEILVLENLDLVEQYGVTLDEQLTKRKSFSG